MLATTQQQMLITRLFPVSREGKLIIFIISTSVLLSFII